MTAPQIPQSRVSVIEKPDDHAAQGKNLRSALHSLVHKPLASQIIHYLQYSQASML